MSIFSPKSPHARPLSGSVLPNYSPIQGGRSRAPAYQRQIGRAGVVQQGPMGEYFSNAALSGLRGLSALGLASTIPGACWDVAGFQDCHATWFAQAQKDCQGGDAAANFGGDMDTCTDIYADQYSIQNCVPKYCPATLPTTQAGGLTAAQVTAIQKTTNAALVANNFKPITVDGKLGPATCGAALYVSQMKWSSVYTDNNLAAYCTAWTNPTMVGKTVPEQTVVLQVSDGITTPTVPAWGVASPTLASTQQQINQSLDAAGYLPIPVTGVLDAATCGAMQWMKANMGQDLMTETGANCQAFTSPTKKPANSTPGTAPKGSPPPPGAPPAPTPPSTHPISSATMLVGGLGLLAAGGLYYYAKKKGMV